MDTVFAGNVEASAQSRRFFFWMAVVFALVAFGGFIPSYWSQLGTANFHPPPIMHIHGALLFTWTLFYLAQTGWVASGRIATHRSWGLVGISLFTLVMCSVVVFSITVLHLAEARGLGEPARRFEAIHSFAVLAMAGVFAAAIANVRRPEIHKRLMYSLMAGMMAPPLARIFLAFFAPPGVADSGPPPPFVAIPPGIVALLFIAIAMIHDWKTQRRWYPVYLYAGLVPLCASILAVLVAPTRAWLAFAAFLQGLGG